MTCRTFYTTFVKAILSLSCVIFTPILCASSWGSSIGYAGGPFGLDNSNQAKGARATVDYFWLTTPQGSWQLFLQGSAAYYHSEYEPLPADHSDTLWTVALAPVVRYHVLPQATYDPFIELSTGPGYLSTIYYENRNLGLHFTWQDMLGIGLNFGEKHQFSTELQIIHYSNAGISDHNRGLTTPLILSVGYQF